MESSNVNAMREALERQVHFLQRLHAQEGENGVVSKVRLEEEIKAVTAALSAPPRNCDKGTAEEQIDRMLAFCGRKGKCTRCEHHRIGTMFRECTLRWAQTPYEANEKGEVDDSNG